MTTTGHASRRAALGFGVAAGLGTLFGCASKSDGDTSTTVTAKQAAVTSSAAVVTSPDEAIARLRAGAARFTAGALSRPDQSIDYRTTLAKGQHPFAAVLSCADSRVPPELVFDQGLGDLFVSRTAGQVVDHAVLGSLQYGIAELKIPLVLVLGHEKCGAVKATVEAVEKKSAAMGNDIDTIVAAIKPAVQRAEKEEPADLLDASVRANVAAVVAALGTKTILKDAVSAGSLKIIGARYDLDEGSVEFLT